MKTFDPKYIRLRTTLIGLAFMALFAVIGAKAFYLQIHQRSWLSRKAADQYERSFIIYGKRGTIYDRKHNELAVSNTVASIAAHPQKIENRAVAAKALAKTLNLDPQSVYRKLDAKKPFVWIKRHVAPGEARSLQALNLNGIVFKTEQSRFYPNKRLAAQIIGFSGIDGNGLEGIEYYYDELLKENGERYTVFKDALGREFESDKDADTGPGARNVVLTIDRTVQFVAEQALQEAVESHAAKSGIAIVMVPKSGAILALAHVPLFNANAHNQYRRDQWRNRAITDQFEPGSTLKIFSAAAALESGSSTPQSIFFCENGKYRIGSDTIHDTHPYGWLSLQKIVKYSSNIGIVKVEEATGPKALYDTLRAFGFGQKTGIDCPGEIAGTFSPYTRWSQIDAGAIAFGQGISVSAIQLISAVGAIANDGVLMQPYIVQAVTDSNGRLIKSTRPQRVRQAVSAETARTVRRIMKSVITSDGTGIHAALKGYSVGGKTGTAQKVDDKGAYAKDRYTASFVGFVPADNPALAILVVVDEPGEKYYGGTVAAPVFRKIAQETLNHLNIPPDQQSDTLTVSLGKRGERVKLSRLLKSITPLEISGPVAAPPRPATAQRIPRSPRSITVLRRFAREGCLSPFAAMRPMVMILSNRPFKTAPLRSSSSDRFSSMPSWQRSPIRARPCRKYRPAFMRIRPTICS